MAVSVRFEPKSWSKWWISEDLNQSPGQNDGFSMICCKVPVKMLDLRGLVMLVMCSLIEQLPPLDHEQSPGQNGGFLKV